LEALRFEPSQFVFGCSDRRQIDPRQIGAEAFGQIASIEGDLSVELVYAGFVGHCTGYQREAGGDLIWIKADAVLRRCGAPSGEFLEFARSL
jgi:hypothetical protein